jgi:hypothetical protein
MTCVAGWTGAAPTLDPPGEVVVVVVVVGTVEVVVVCLVTICGLGPAVTGAVSGEFTGAASCEITAFAPGGGNVVVVLAGAWVVGGLV